MKFEKNGVARFLSHLDLLKVMERALRRAEIPVSYTEGFHQRIRLSFGPALALGHASRCEWLDLEMAEPMDADELRARFNAALPPGLSVAEARSVPLTVRSLGAAIRRGRYEVILDGEPPSTADLRDAIRRLLDEQEIALKKKNKTVNLRRFVEDLQVAERASASDEPGGAPGAEVVLEMTLSLGPEGSVRPEDVLAALDGIRAGVGAPQDALEARHVERVALLEPRGGAWLEPWPSEAAGPVKSAGVVERIEGQERVDNTR